MVLKTVWGKCLELCDLVVGSRKERLGKGKHLFFFKIKVNIISTKKEKKHNYLLKIFFFTEF